MLVLTWNSATKSHPLTSLDLNAKNLEDFKEPMLYQTGKEEKEDHFTTSIHIFLSMNVDKLFVHQRSVQMFACSLVYAIGIRNDCQCRSELGSSDVPRSR